MYTAPTVVKFIGIAGVTVVVRAWSGGLGWRGGWEKGSCLVDVEFEI